MRILAIEPYAARSHVAFLEGLRAHSAHTVELWTLPARAWKWRMRTASLEFADRLAAETEPVDLLLVSDYLSVPELLANLPRERRDLPIVALFHENQLTYPLQEGEARDHQYALTHLHSILGAQHTVFFSEYHRRSFFEALRALLRHAPDVRWRPWVERAEASTSVLPLGSDVPLREPVGPAREPILLWNHRWEYDKGPDRFRAAVLALAEEDRAFRVRLLGERFRAPSDDRRALCEALGDRVEDLGFLASRADYLEALNGAHVHVSAARHEFFGLSALEALRAGLLPVWPRALAYPDLLPDPFRADDRFLYGTDPEDRVVSTLTAMLRNALEALRCDAWRDDRRALQARARRTDWPAVARAFDDVFRVARSDLPVD